MKPLNIVAADDPALRIPFDIPVKGKRPLRITLPRFDFISESELDDVQAAIGDIDPDLAPHKRQRLAYLLQVKPFVTSAAYVVVETLALGQLSQLMTKWQDASAVTLGEFLASETSSTESTGRPSSPTSLTAAGADETSGAA